MRREIVRIVCVCFSAAGLIVPLGFARSQPPVEQGWPQWRGPNGSGVSGETGWNPLFAAKGPKKKWEAKVGRGFSSPVVSGDRLYVFSTDPGDLQVERLQAFDRRTGEELWKQSYEIQSLRRASTPLGGTPAIAGDKIFTYGAAMTLTCRETKSGKQLWSRDLMAELPGNPAPYGFQLSPTPHENLIIVPAICQKSPSTRTNGKMSEPRGGPYAGDGGVILAFDQATGKEVWRSTEGASAWSSPILATIGGKKTLIHLTGRLLLGIDPASGATRWKIDLRDTGIRAEDMAASPVVHGDIVVAPVHKAYGSTSNGTAGSAAYRIANGTPKLLWKNDQWCHWFQSAAIWDQCLYAFDERSVFWCLDLQTGKEKWHTKELGSTGKNGGGFMIVDGKVLALDARQSLTVAEVSAAGHRVLSRAAVMSAASGFECETAPLLLDGCLYCRNHTQLICFDLGQK